MQILLKIDSNKFLNSKQGFTLIELIMVIVILGILAAVAIPKFADFSTETRTASQNAVESALRAGAALAHSACLVQSSCNPKAATSTVAYENGTVEMVYGYPAATAGGIISTVDLQNMNQVTYLTGPGWRWVGVGVNAEDRCYIGYMESTAAGSPPGFEGGANNCPED